MEGPPPFTAQSLEACLAGTDPSSFYLPPSPDLRESTDTTLVVAGTELPAHCAVLALRAAAFAPLLATPAPRRLEAPFGIEQLRQALLLLRLLYRPEEASVLQQPCCCKFLPGAPPAAGPWGGGPPAWARQLCPCIRAADAPGTHAPRRSHGAHVRPAPRPSAGLLPALHRVDALGLLGGLARGRGVDALPLREAAHLLNACCELPGLEQLAAACAVTVVNSIDCELAAPSVDPRTQRCVRPTLGRRGQAWLESLKPGATLLIARAALSVVADSQWRSQLRGEHEPAYVAALDMGDAELLAAPARKHKRTRHTWRVKGPNIQEEWRHLSPVFR